MHVEVDEMDACQVASDLTADGRLVAALVVGSS
jgi:hypothetical protein